MAGDGAWSLLAWLAATCALASFGTWVALGYARRRRLLDEPGERRSHAVATPRGGGIGITFALLVVAIAAVLGGRAEWTATAFALAGLLAVAGIGWVDDHRPLSPLSRLLVQCLAGMLLGLGLFALDGRWGWALLACAAVPVLVNVWNFMDGINGLASSQALVAGATLAVGDSEAGMAGACLAAACAGFLPFNFPKARIFLGDVGSGTLGYALAAAVLLVASAPDTPVLKGLWVLLPLSAFLVDASLTLLGRMTRGEKWWQPHVSHLYQRWVRAGRSHAFVTASYGAFSFVAAILATILGKAGPLVVAGTVVTWLLLAVAVWVLCRRSIH
jgi:UDP-N-acetylmuramyl pentapeptide phosphotransferase/UDP-N-acetylglucosamine-1-phosphate transferase